MMSCALAQRSGFRSRSGCAVRRSGAGAGARSRGVRRSGLDRAAVARGALARRARASAEADRRHGRSRPAHGVRARGARGEAARREAQGRAPHAALDRQEAEDRHPGSRAQRALPAARRGRAHGRRARTSSPRTRWTIRPRRCCSGWRAAAGSRACAGWRRLAPARPRSARRARAACCCPPPARRPQVPPARDARGRQHPLRRRSLEPRPALHPAAAARADAALAAEGLDARSALRCSRAAIGARRDRAIERRGRTRPMRACARRRGRTTGRCRRCRGVRRPAGRDRAAAARPADRHGSGTRVRWSWASSRALCARWTPVMTRCEPGSPGAFAAPSRAP